MFLRISMGYYSNPPGVKLYTVQGKDCDGLTIYRCMHRTNNVEGGVHQNIVRCFGSFNASPKFAVSLLRDYVLCHNLKLAHLIDETADVFSLDSADVIIAGFMNGNDYARSTESFGILPLSESSRTQLGMLPYSADFVAAAKIRHGHLAKQQCTRITILPLHMPEECAIFQMLMNQHGGPFMGPTQLNWVMMAANWSNCCNGQHIFYKLPEHLKNYYKVWKENRNKENSVEQQKEVYNRITTLLLSQPECIPAIPTQPRASITKQIDLSNHVAVASEVPSNWHVGILLGTLSIKQSTVQFQYGDGSSSNNQQDQAQGKKRRRKTCDGENDSEEIQKSRIFSCTDNSQGCPYIWSFQWVLAYQAGQTVLGSSCPYLALTLTRKMHLQVLPVAHHRTNPLAFAQLVLSPAEARAVDILQWRVNLRGRYIPRCAVASSPVLSHRVYYGVPHCRWQAWLVQSRGIPLGTLSCTPTPTLQGYIPFTRGKGMGKGTKP
ncbi:hypothetical protein BKA93DRAFT_748186 [Sparassis latifolia]